MWSGRSYAVTAPISLPLASSCPPFFSPAHLSLLSYIPDVMPLPPTVVLQWRGWGARSDPGGSGRDGSISGGFGVEAAGSGEIKGWWRHGPSGGPCSARKRERGERRSRGRRRGARRRSGRSSGGEARRRCGVAGEAACGGEGSSGRMEQREAERSGLGWVFRVIFVKVKRYPLKQGLRVEFE